VTAKKKGKKEPPGFNSPFTALESLKKELEAKADQSKAPPKPVAPPPRPVATTPAEDELSFHRMMSGVVPLDQGLGRIAKSKTALERGSVKDAATRKAEALALAAAETELVHERLRELVDGDGRFEVEDDGKRVEGRRDDVRPDVVRKLRRGLVPIDARLDLHGHRATEAQAALGKFLGEKRARGERCVLVVHGKGEHSPGGHGVLRGEISAWLSQGRASEHVAAFVTATDHDGGEGAMYVLLRR
jgi:DNA-nicking Smr family endonuclease